MLIIEKSRRLDRTIVQPDKRSKGFQIADVKMLFLLSILIGIKGGDMEVISRGPISAEYLPVKGLGDALVNTTLSEV